MGRRRDSTCRRLVDQAEHAYAVHEDDGAAEPAADRQEHEADERDHERPGVHGPMRVAAVPDERGDQEEDGRGQHRSHVPSRRPPDRRAPLER